jgi:hypothetical protein
LFWRAAVFGERLPANRNRCHHPRHHHMRQRPPHTTHRGHMYPRHILEPNHMHQRHPQTHNMKTDEDEGIVKAIRDGARPAWPSMNGCKIVRQRERRSSGRVNAGVWKSDVGLFNHLTSKRSGPPATLTACVAGIGVSLLVAALLALFLKTPMAPEGMGR